MQKLVILYQDPCLPGGHHILDDYRRSQFYQAESPSSLICDKFLEHGWYKFEINGNIARIPTTCPEVNHCGTQAPIWLPLNISLQVGQVHQVTSCTTWALPGSQSSGCCTFRNFLKVQNCGSFLVYHLQPTLGCYMAYCAETVKLSETVIDLSRPPYIRPRVIQQEIVLTCEFDIRVNGVSVERTSELDTFVWISWFKLDEENNRRIHLQTFQATSEQDKLLIVGKHAHLGETVLCMVKLQNKHTKSVRNSSLRSEHFYLGIRAEPQSLVISENGSFHPITFTSSLPYRCTKHDYKDCELLIQLQTKTISRPLQSSDVALSSCIVHLSVPEQCQNDCGTGRFFVTAIQDLIEESSTKNIIEAKLLGIEDSIWTDYKISDVEVTIQDIPFGWCYSFTETHYITFDSRRFDYYKTGTFVLYKSTLRNFEVHARTWFCGSSHKSVSCNCGFAALENNDLVKVDVCSPRLLSTSPSIVMTSLGNTQPEAKIIKSKQGKVLTVLFQSGSFVRAIFEEWGMSIVLRVPGLDFGYTHGLCGIFDRDPTNDFHDIDGKILGSDINKFFNIWSLDSGESLFDEIPNETFTSSNHHSCICSTPVFTPTSNSNGNLDVSYSVFSKNGYEFHDDHECNSSNNLNCVKSCEVPEILDFHHLFYHRDITKTVVLQKGYNTVEENGEVLDININKLYPEASNEFYWLNNKSSEYNETDIRPVVKKNSSYFLEIPLQRDRPFSTKNSKLHIINFFQFKNVTSKWKFQHGSKKWDIKSRRKRSPRGDIPVHMVLPFTSESDLTLFPSGDSVEHWPTPSGRTKEQIVNLCTDVLTNSTIAHACSQYLEKHMLEAIGICVLDVALTDDPDWAKYSIPLLESRCEEEILRQHADLTKDEKEFHLQDIIRAVSCPEGCNGHGQCVQENCLCHKDYYGIDCSLYRGSEEIFTLKEAGIEGLCDDFTSSCSQVRVTGSNFKASLTLSCKVTLVKFDNNTGDFHIAGISSVLSASYLDNQTIQCPLPDTDEEKVTAGPEITWEIKISSDNVEFSSPVFVTVYNSSCQSCVSDHPPLCKVHENICVINGKCHHENERSPEDNCKICIPFISRYQWIPDPRNTAPVLQVPLHPLKAFHGENFVYKFEAIDPENREIYFELVSGLPGASLSKRGILEWTAEKKNAGESSSVAFNLIVSDSCNMKTEYRSEIEVLPCKCEHKGKCVKSPHYKSGNGNYTCSCNPGFTGEFCQFEVDPCAPDPCSHGMCIINGEGFQCLCYVGFSGEFCQIQSDPCIPNPCHHGLCIIRGRGFQCLCDVGFSGEFCEVGVDPCLSNPCYHGACVETGSGFQCICDVGFSVLCHLTCLNGGLCFNQDSCWCPHGFTGNHCETAVCDPSCINGGRCLGGNKCACQYGYVGRLCETAVCSRSCHNGGLCKTPNKCSCLSGWRGPTCEEPVCDPVCQNGGTCSQPNLCICPPGFFGVDCSSGICHPPCHNGGHCMRHNLCSCPKGWIGARCLIPVCEPRCLNGGRCWKPNKCSCPSGWRGRRCHKATCLVRCRNGGTCVKPNTCVCPPGVRGLHCEQPICSESCYRGGKCVSPGNCLCYPGYSGNNCEVSQRKNIQKRKYQINRHRHGYRLQNLFTHFHGA
ncbi:von Willebrand factor D and EGF domain-containing protein-like isoform X2 [Tachypleus tridentatus]|uniref:von Willebrand factor D and EGF domain-containing protein-like isoform X2 n=1 Tax=Tachypleus tridentatus TaxID=6853 RepID=UPI003FD5BD76